MRQAHLTVKMPRQVTECIWQRLDLTTVCNSNFPTLAKRFMQQLPSHHMLIPWQDLSEAALQGVIEDYVTREGTEYGDQAVSLMAKVAQVQAQLRSGTVVIVFDGESSTCSIVSKQQLAEVLEAKNQANSD